MRGPDGITDAVDMNLGELWEMVRGREAWHPAVHGAAKSQNDWVTESNNLDSSSTSTIILPGKLRQII